MSEPYEPANGTEGACFIDSWCSNCARDRVMNGEVSTDDADDTDYCPILTNSFVGPQKEWQETPDGPVCTAFIPIGQPATAQRCDQTIELPL